MKFLKVIRSINYFLIIYCVLSLPLKAKENIRIFSWEGYVTKQDIKNLNILLSESNYQYQATLIETLAEDSEQMFSVIRSKQCDIAFLTLFFIKMEGNKTTRLLKSIDINSPRLTNYKYLDPNLTHIQMGMKQGKPLYIPWGGGIYGFYINKDRTSIENIPTSLSDVWHWENKYSLNKGQFWYNVGLALQSLGYHPFYLNELANNGQRTELAKLTNINGKLQKRLNSLYKHAGDLWTASPEFKQHLKIISSWGPEIKQQNKSGQNWQLIDFKEGKQAWLDTINFSKSLSGKKLEAAEIIANYFISKRVQQRITEQLSMIPASTQVKNRGLLSVYPDIFKNGYFVPPFNELAHSIMQQMVLVAEKEFLISTEQKK
ncbi:extracellular solute-binding protein [Pseudoalteromonas denitrificans]|uniref:Spermidine/putrescine-binding protein n=1 Tax=Pseudoalteromonas denitrificans DSM 6059 TaxID=1123010 RepID=A0A1I1UHT3_9GAMM|nr:extracellular solute-binding protein [Pseudoalteromonas denitrificans]SFD70254.1 Spermidine/putrescine-binding protein [Pseudoalteromonas denitrificans DSM 6059]